MESKGSEKETAEKIVGDEFMVFDRRTMQRGLVVVALLMLISGLAEAKDPEDPRTRIEVKAYGVDATINPASHQLDAKVK